MKDMKDKTEKLPKEGFRHFIQNYGVIPLAVGVVIGTAVNDFVKLLVDGLISPLISLVSPQTSLANFQVTIGDSVFKIGAVINGAISFLVVAWVVYVLAKFVLRNPDILKK